MKLHPNHPFTRKATRIATAMLISISVQAQNNLVYVPGEGFRFHLNNGAYQFDFGGMIQPEISYLGIDGQDPQYFFANRRTYLRLQGEAGPQKLTFFVQANLNEPEILLDAWIAYKPIEGLEFKAGQMLSVGNNREMLWMEDYLSFIDRSALSQQLSRSGREFGLAVSYGRPIAGVHWTLHAMLSSGDGRNSFGADSRDVDLGGLKYAGRLDVLPLGLFTKGNERQMADLAGEQDLKLLLGFAGSINNGASDRVGEDHGGVVLYGFNGQLEYANFRKVYADVLMKYRGFALMGEYGIATAAGLEGLYSDPFGESPLQPEEISEHYNLGRAWNAHASYTHRGAWGIDVRLSDVQPEFERTGSLQVPVNSLQLGLTRYFSGQQIKVHLAAGSEEINGVQQTVANLFCQLRF
ncbi:hypothetical protein GC167_07640 [bacterium]|nr:hypothetical protein [bacterium]